MPNIHPLRPKENSVLVCENKKDAEFVGSIILKYGPNIYITYGDGVEKLPKLAAILAPAFYIRDRDFDYSVKDATDSYSNKKPKLIWTHIDIEGYLIHSDWLWRCVQFFKNGKYPLAGSLPSSQAKIETDLRAIAERLIPDHAGRRTCCLINQSLGINKRGSFGVPQGISKKTSIAISSQTDWEAKLLTNAKVVKQNLIDASNSSKFTDIIDDYRNQIKIYNGFSKSHPEIRLHFSGEKILRILAHQWGVNWEMIRQKLIEYAINHSQTITTKLSDDPRLADFGHIAFKLTGKKV